MMKTILIVLTSILISTETFAQTAELRGQLSSWLTYDDGLTDKTLIGLRYIPELDLTSPLKEDMSLDAEISLKAYSEAPTNDLSDLSDNSHLDPYRIWGRFATNQFEARLGLQKINFGPTKLLRSLMWFDRVDPRDPFELTDGVDALLLRYYFLNNANIWLWGLYGNDELKGSEVIRTDEDKIEAGGRFQFPVTKGELALSFHQRTVDSTDWKSKVASVLLDGTERRLALDGNWDVGVGLWFEAEASRLEIDSSSEFWEGLITIGSDYTFGSGIFVIGEYFIRSTGEEFNHVDKVGEMTAFSAEYNLGLLDRINMIAYYDWELEKSSTFLGWQRTYDNWLINLLAFSKGSGRSGTFSGDGLQLIITYNH